MTDLYETHRGRLEAAVDAARTRAFYSPFIESPSRRHHPDGAHDAGRAAFEARLGRSFELDQPGTIGRTGHEVSPYTRQPLGIDYPAVDPDALLVAAHAAMPTWRDAGPRARVGVCMEVLERWHRNGFENAYATMHTAGQAFMLGFAGSGASSLDRGLEALTYAHRAMADIPATATFERRFGRGAPVVLDKRYRLMPVGVAIVISCGSYPAWNAYPAILANLATGNPVVLKPHPNGILPMAIAVEIGRRVLAEAGFDPNLLTLAADTWDAPITLDLLGHPATAIVDFTGGQRFGARLEREFAHLQVYTETAGCNSVVLESADDLDAALHAVAHSVCMFSSQMCTAAQNIFVPADGVRTPDGTVPFAAVGRRLVEAIDRLVAEPAHAAGLCGAVQSERTMADIAALGEAAADRGRILRASSPYAHPEFPDARTATPLLVEVDAAERALYGREHFGPMAFVIRAADRDHALARATEDARAHGAIASYAYTTDPAFESQVEDAYALAGASVGVNLLRQLPINFAAALSDFHVTGLNPAGNACLTDLAFVSRRFRVVQSKVERPG
jgi:phenylacetic acid degradation protein paaN